MTAGDSDFSTKSQIRYDRTSQYGLGMAVALHDEHEEHAGLSLWRSGVRGCTGDRRMFPAFEAWFPVCVGVVDYIQLMKWRRGEQ